MVGVIDRRTTGSQLYRAIEGVNSVAIGNAPKDLSRPLQDALYDFELIMREHELDSEELDAELSGLYDNATRLSNYLASVNEFRVLIRKYTKELLGRDVQGHTGILDNMQTFALQHPTMEQIMQTYDVSHRKANELFVDLNLEVGNDTFYSIFKQLNYLKSTAKERKLEALQALDVELTDAVNARYEEAGLSERFVHETETHSGNLIGRLRDKVDAIESSFDRIKLTESREQKKQRKRSARSPQTGTTYRPPEILPPGIPSRNIRGWGLRANTRARWGV